MKKIKELFCKLKPKTPECIAAWQTFGVVALIIAMICLAIIDIGYLILVVLFTLLVFSIRFIYIERLDEVRRKNGRSR
jgi:hypothetical protein